MIWKQIEGWELYLISNTGLVKSFNQNKKGKILNLHPNSNEYLRVWLYKEDYRKRFFVHHLVALHFKKNPNSYKYIDHKNRVRTDNRAINLRWCSIEQNLKNRKFNKKKRYKSTRTDYDPF